MELLNRSAITITAKEPYINWANSLTPELPMQAKILGESHTYLTNPDFDNAEKHLKKYYKTIFENELFGIWTDENDWPKNRSFKMFCEWFQIEISDWVEDLSTKHLFED